MVEEIYLHQRNRKTCKNVSRVTYMIIDAVPYGGLNILTDYSRPGAYDLQSACISSKRVEQLEIHRRLHEEFLRKRGNDYLTPTFIYVGGRSRMRKANVNRRALLSGSSEIDSPTKDSFGLSTKKKSKLASKRQEDKVRSPGFSANNNHNF